MRRPRKVKIDCFDPILWIAIIWLFVSAVVLIFWGPIAMIVTNFVIVAGILLAYLLMMWGD